MVDTMVPNKAKWFQWVRGKPPDESIDRLSMLIVAYHKIPGTDVESRTATLNEIESLCLSVLHKEKKNPVWQDKYHEPVFQLGSAAFHRLNTITKAKGNWGKLKKVLPTNSPQPTLQLINRGAKGAAPTAAGNYWLELMDPKHRSWGHEGANLFALWLAAATDLNFWEWLESTGKGTFPGVAYLSPDERWKHEVVFSGKRMYLSQDRNRTSLNLLTTKDWSSAHTCAFIQALLKCLPPVLSKGMGIWVCSPNKAFYTAGHIVSQFHHSSFLAGERVLGAGEWVVSQGLLMLVSNKTGHYQAGMPHLLQCLVALAPKADLSRTVVAAQTFSGGKPKMDYVLAADFIRAGGNPAAFAAHVLKGTEAEEPLLSAIFRASANKTWDDVVMGAKGTPAWSPPKK